ncbi:MAG: hypothetical protein Q8Q01_03070 [archaeon]|nr:hypothetical protein [archaeon]
MNKKRKDVARKFSTKGQITIFLILGVVVLFAFLFVFLLTSGIQKGQLLQEKENVLSKALKKESLRIFVEDCLYDSMAEGLSLLGQQGRIWKDQGGQINFVNGVNGLTLDNGDQVAYAITDERYADGHLSAYPCNNINNYPEYCLYSSPNITTGFGTVVLRESTIEGDLGGFLLKKTKECVTGDIYETVSEDIIPDDEGAELTPTITRDGIVVKVYYPLRLELAGEEFFQVSSFDFFYKSRLQDLLDAAISSPVRLDQKYVDFNYSGFDEETGDTLSKESFTYQSPKQSFGFQNSPLCEGSNAPYTCQLVLRSDLYGQLAMEKEVSVKEDTHDTILTFTTPNSNILTQPGENENVEGMYQFRVARQNRPPALDYIGRNQCFDAQEPYDYLVIPNLIDDEGNLRELSKINIRATAQDADEELPTISFKEIDPVLNNLDSPDDDAGSEIFFKSVSSSVEPGIYPLTVIASDGIKEDNQTVRVLIDRPIETDVSISLPYTLTGGVYDEIYAGGDFFPISKEDPVFVNVVLPDESAAFGAAGAKLLTYKYKPEDEEIISYDIPMFRKDTYSFPGVRLPGGDIDSYSEEDIVSWDFSKGPLNPFSQETDRGLLSVSFGMTYCGLPDEIESKSTVEVRVAECIPNKNSQHPYAYPYNNYYTEDGDLSKLNLVNENDPNAINPFLATHSCCTDRWEYVEKNDPNNPCFVNPEPGCYGQLTEYVGGPTLLSDSLKGYVWEEQVQLCSGERGNICNGAFNNQLYNNQLWCGIQGKNSCTRPINDACENKLAFTSIENQGVCWGTLGCGNNLCTQPLAYTGQGNIPNINTKATELFLQSGSNPTTAPGFEFSCGCPENDLGPDGVDLVTNVRCDDDWSGNFDGFCTLSGRCEISGSISEGDSG